MIGRLYPTPVVYIRESRFRSTQLGRTLIAFFHILFDPTELQRNLISGIFQNLEFHNHRGLLQRIDLNICHNDDRRLQLYKNKHRWMQHKSGNLPPGDRNHMGHSAMAGQSLIKILVLKYFLLNKNQ